VDIEPSSRDVGHDVEGRYAEAFDLVKARLSRTRNVVPLTRQVG